MKAMILAAGRGTRMAPLTDQCPKPLLPLAGKSLIVHHIEKLVAAGFTELVINHAYLGHKIEQQLGDGRAFGAQIQYSAESEALETGGGILKALPMLSGAEGNEPFLLVNGDVWTDWDYRSAAEVTLNSSLGYLWLGGNPEHNPDGDFILQDGKVINPLAQDVSRAQQNSHNTTMKLTFSGISILHPQLFRDCTPGKFPLAPLLREAMDNGRMLGEQLSNDWVDVGTPQRLAELEARLQQQKMAFA